MLLLLLEFTASGMMEEFAEGATAAAAAADDDVDDSVCGSEVVLDISRLSIPFAPC